MKYILRKRGLGKVPEIEISEQEYLGLEWAKLVLSEALRIEEKYEMLLQNYLAFEKLQMNFATESMVRTFGGYEEAFDIRLRLNIHLLNLFDHNPSLSRYDIKLCSKMCSWEFRDKGPN